MSVTNISTFKIAKLTAQIIETVKRDGVASLKEYGELPLQFGLASEVLMSADCPEDVALVLKGRTVARYAELIKVSAAASPETVSAASKVTAGKGEEEIPPTLAGDVSLSYLAIPITDEMDADGLLEYVNEMVGALREKMGGDGYSVEEREALVGIHKELDHTESEVHVFIDTDILGEEVYAKIVEEYFDAEGYEVMDAAEYEEKHQLPALLASLPEDTLMELASQLEVTAKKGKKLTASYATAEILKLDKDAVVAAIDAVVGGGESSDEGDSTDVSEIVGELSIKQLRDVAAHLEIKISKTAKSGELVDAILEEDESEVTDALDALGLLPDSGEETGEGEFDAQTALEALDRADLVSVAKALEISHTKKTTDGELLDMLLEAEEEELHEALTDLGLLDGEDDAKPDTGSDEKDEVELADALEECELPVLKAITTALELKAPIGKKATKEAFIELLTGDDVDEGEVMDAMLEAKKTAEGEEEGDDDEARTAELKEKLEAVESDVLQAIAEDLEVKVVGKATTLKLIKAILDCDLDDVAAAIDANAESEEEEEGDSLESLYSLLADCKAARGGAAERKELLASLAETDLVDAKRKDVVTLQKIAALTEIDEETNTMIELLAGDETPLTETVLGYFTKVFAAEIKEAVGEQEEPETPAKPAGRGGKVNRTAGGKK